MRSSYGWRKEMLLMAIVLSLGWYCCLVEGRLATQKCEEYKNIVINRQTQHSLLLLDQHPIQEYNCTNVVQLIVGGEQAKNGEFPHHALLGYPKQSNPQDIDFKCGGTLISDQHILTAAHCFSEEDPTVVRLGEYDTTFEAGNEYESDIVSIRKHPNFKYSSSYDDIVLVKLKHPIALSKHIRPACLWETEDREVERHIATGFGPIDAFGESSTVMMKVQLEEFPVGDCAKIYKGDRRFRNGIQDGQLCISNVCQSDGGSPLQVMSDPKTCTYAVVGISSAGGICGIENSKAIYTKVSHYIDWIEDNVWGANAM